MANDPHWNSVVLAMHMDDTGLTDLKGHAVTLNGNAARSATQSKFGGYSAAFDGSGDFLTVPAGADFNPGAGDFTVEFFVYLSSVATSGLVALGPSGYVPVLVFCTANEFRLYAASSGASSWNVANGVAFKTGVVAGQWYHVAVCRSGTSLRAFCDGVLGTTVTTTATLADSVTALHVGIWSDLSGSKYLSGFIDDLRITKDVARYTANFAVPTEAFPNTPPQLIGTVTDANSNPASRPVIAIPRNRASASYATISDATTGAFTLPAYDGSEHTVIALPVEGDPYWGNVVLALHMDGTNGSTTFTDQKGKTVTANGNAQISTAQSKFGGASALFDGTGDYLAIPASTDMDFGSGDFTIELWYRPGSIAAAQYILTRKSAAAASDGFILAQPSGDPTKIIFLAGDSSTTGFEVSITCSESLVVGTWCHVAVTRSGGIFRLFIDGVCQSVGGWGGIIHYASTPTYVGISYDLSTGSVNGYIDDLRITKGVARYIHNFTPPSAQFPHAITGGTENALILDNITPV